MWHPVKSNSNSGSEHPPVRWRIFVWTWPAPLVQRSGAAGSWWDASSSLLSGNMSIKISFLWCFLATVLAFLCKYFFIGCLPQAVVGDIAGDADIKKKRARFRRNSSLEEGDTGTRQRRVDKYKLKLCKSLDLYW